MNAYKIRKFKPGDEKAIEEITYRTGFKGEDLTGKDYFNDQYLFYLIFIYYYPRYEPEHCFVAVEDDSKSVIGFICGTTNTHRQEIRFRWKITLRIIFRISTHTIWQDSRTMVTLFKLARMIQPIGSLKTSAIKTTYPAHLHINILQEHQRKGLGMRLIRHFENHLANLRINGVHLKTSSYNSKAIPFYFKAGFKVVDEHEMKHPEFKKFIILTFAKTIQ